MQGRRKRREQHRDQETDRQTDRRERGWRGGRSLSHSMVTVPNVVIQGSLFPLETWKHQHLLELLSSSTDQNPLGFVKGPGPPPGGLGVAPGMEEGRQDAARSGALLCPHPALDGGLRKTGHPLSLHPPSPLSPIGPKNVLPLKGPDQESEGLISPSPPTPPHPIPQLLSCCVTSCEADAPLWTIKGWTVSEQVQASLSTVAPSAPCPHPPKGLPSWRPLHALAGLPRGTKQKPRTLSSG